MASTYAKGLPASVQHLVHSSDRLAEVPRNPHAAASSTLPGAAFRQDASSSSSSGTSNAAAYDFDAFREAQGAQLGDSRLSRAWDGAAASASDTGPAFAAPPPHANQLDTGRSAAQDGAELASLVSGGGLLAAVDGDWEEELLARQREPWRVELESRMPLDPFASSASAKGKGRAMDGPDAAIRAGDMSPTSTELLSSLSSLDLADRAYLRTLLAQDPASAFEDYFSRGSYTDDVYGLPPAVQRLFEKANQRDERIGVEEGRKKAVRRLGMVLRHMQAAADPVGGVERQTANLSLDGGASAQSASAWSAATGQPDPLMRHHLAPTSAHHAPLSSFSSSGLAQQSSQQTSQQDSRLAQHVTTASYADYSVPSSLSESAFITITPPPSSPPAPMDAQRPYAPTHGEQPATDPEIDTPVPSTAHLLERHMTRVRSNSEGRFGPAFSRSPSPVEAVAMAEAGADVQMRGEEGQAAKVTEGRTH